MIDSGNNSLSVIDFERDSESDSLFASAIDSGRDSYSDAACSTFESESNSEFVKTAVVDEYTDSVSDVTGCDESNVLLISLA